MTIGIDARHDEAGPGRYTFSLIRELAKVDSENSYVLFLRPAAFATFEVPGPNFRKVLADFHWFTVAEQLRFPPLLRRERLDLMHYPHFNVPILSTTPFVVTIHDLNYSHLDLAPPGLRAQLRRAVKSSGYSVSLQKLKSARAILTVSTYSKKDIVRELGIPSRKVTVTYEGADPASLGPPDPETLARHHIDKPYFFYVGSAYPYKNLLKLIEAFAELVTHDGRDLQLVLAGDHEEYDPPLRDRARELGVGERVIFPGRVSDPELAALYEHALAYTFVSTSEGFGLPGLEAMAAGVPVVAARSASLPEVYGDAAHYVDPNDPDTIAKGLREVAEDGELRKKLVQKGYARLKRFSWRKMAEETLEVYRRALSGR